MTIASHTNLVVALQTRLDRDIPTHEADTFIQLAEARLNRLLDDPEMETSVTLTAIDSFTPLPADFGSIVSISTGDGPLLPVGAVEFAGYDQSISGTPRHYVILDGEIGLAPANSSAVITMVYRRRIPPLKATDPSNWLLVLAPDAYLHGTLAEAFAWDKDEERASIHKAVSEQIIAELVIDASKRKWGAGSLAPRINRP